MTRELLITSNTIEPDHATGQLTVLETGEPFDGTAYSQLKYGSIQAARSMGQTLGEKILQDAPDAVLDSTQLEAAVVYKAVPPACYLLSRFCLDVINLQRTNLGLEPGRIVQIHKGSVVALDYAASLPGERETALASITYDTDGHSFRDKAVLVVDDIRITGTTERRARQAIISHNPKVLAFGYAALMNEEVGLRDAAVEDRINHSYVTRLDQIRDMIDGDDFMLNIRTLKRILSPQEASQREDFLAAIPDTLLYDIYFGAISTGPDFTEQYLEGFQQVSLHLKARGLIS